jgi:hypothetical protein
MYVSLNISSRNIKILSLKGRKVARWGTADLAPGMVRDGLILQPQAVGEAIASLFKSAGIKKGNVIVGVTGLSFTYRFISLPRLKPSLLEEAIIRAARKEISSPLDELYLSWQPVPGKGPEQDYFVLGVPRNLVDAAVQTLKIAGIEPYLMDLRPLALARIAGRSEAIVVSMEPDCFDIVFINKGLPVVIHTVTPRGEGATLEDNVSRLSDELAKAATFYQSSQPDIQLSPATPLLLTGEMATEAVTYGLQSQVEYTIEHLIPPAEYPERLPITTYAANIGLALKRTPVKQSVRGGAPAFFDIDINILTGKYRKPKAKSVPVKIWLTTALLVVVVGLLYPLYEARSTILAENAALEENLSNIDRELNLANLVNEETISTESSIRDILAESESLKTANNIIFDARGYFGAVLEHASGAFPSKASYTSVEIQKDGIIIKGEADSVFTVVAYAEALEAQGAFTEVRISKLDETLITLPGSGETEPAAVEGINVITFEIYAQTAPLNQ